MAKATKGRPAGSPNREVDHAEAKVTRCEKCGSTERTPYFNRHEQAIAGLDGEGDPYTHIIRRRTKCLECGQHRIDRHHENRGGKR